MSCDGLEGQSPPAHLRWRAYGHVWPTPPPMSQLGV